MKLHIKSPIRGTLATADYDEITGKVTVHAGSVVSKDICESPKFKSSAAIIRWRQNNVKDGVLMKDAVFKSLSTAANYVRGTSTNGLAYWKNDDGISIGELLKNKK